MEARLHVVDEERELYDRKSKGKNSWVSGDEYTIEPSSKELTIVAHTSEYIGSGDRGGTPKRIVRTLTLWLSPRDLKRFVNAAFDSGLLTAAVTIAKPKKAKRTKMKSKDSR
jgi:hypothetical protein